MYKFKYLAMIICCVQSVIRVILAERPQEVAPGLVMAGAHVGRTIKWNHPSHPHPLSLLDAQKTYSAYDGKWRCDVCQKVYDAKRAPFVEPVYRDSEDPDHRHFYHCSRCNFDVCSVCFKGHIHTFHRHRLKKARTTIVYPDPDSLWRCDGCKTVHSEHTDQLCYHCQKCEVDLCSTCFTGTWSHILHSSGMTDPQGHTLKPMDPRIEYRTYQEWTCDNCNSLFSCLSENIAFHCSKCNFDLCEKCFSGEKHHLHLHPIVLIKAKSNSMLKCSNCENPIHQTYYHCKHQSCKYCLCVNCHSRQPQLHPYHPHPLHVCDPLVQYPQSGGMWHCDRCTSNSVSRRPTPLSHAETMYHCQECEFDLCYSCYSEGLMPGHNSAVQEDIIRPVQVTQEASYNTPETSDFSYSSGYATYQPYSHTTYYTTQDYQSRLSRPLVTGMQAPLTFLPSLQAPSHRMCILCQRSEATTTFIHRGRPHSGHPLCCSSCAIDVLSHRRPCPACKIPPDDVFHTS